MANPSSVVKPCHGGEVAFGLTGQAISIYARKHVLCISEFQDARYGKGNRLHTLNVNKPGNPRCTVCGFGNGVVRP